MSTAAEHPIDEHEDEHENTEQKRPKEITVIYLGEPRQLEYEAEELVKDALARALDLFGITNNRHLLALFDEAGVEITNEEQTMKKAGVKRGAKLLLGQSKVKGG